MDSTFSGRSDARPARPPKAHDEARSRPEGGNRSGRPGTTPRRFDPVAELKHMDREIIRLVAGRARLLAGLPKSGAPGRERDLRAAWEEAAAAESRDPRFVRRLFTLLQELEVNPARAENAPAFNLAPARGEVTVVARPPACSRQARLFLALAAGSGSRCRLTGLSLNSLVLECLKAFNQVGAQLRWEEPDRVECAAGPGLSESGGVLDKVVHVGSDPLNLYLVLFRMLTRPARLKFVGEGDMTFLDSSALRRFLPRLGARLTQAVPGREGLPIRLESSAMLPDEVRPDADLPADAVTALLLTAPFWDRPVRFDLAEVPDAAALLSEAEDVLRACGAEVTISGSTLRVVPGALRVPEEPELETDAAVAACLAAFPAVAGGRTVLKECRFGRLGAKRFRNLLEPRLELTEEGREFAVRPRTDFAPESDPADLSLLPAAFVPVGLALALIDIMRAGEGDMPLLPAGTDTAAADGFVNRAGLVRQGRRLKAAGEEADAAGTPWTAPDAFWAFALALLALERPRLKLSNPTAATAYLPWFWKLYNALPTPPEMPQAFKPDEPAPAVRRRRRILAGYMPESEMPVPVREEDE